MLTWRGLTTYYVLFFLHLETRRVTLAGITQHRTEEWMVQVARRAVDDVDGTLLPIRFALHDRDRKFCASFQDTLRSAGIQPLLLPARSPNLKAFAERRVRSIKNECLSKPFLFGEASFAPRSNSIHRALSFRTPAPRQRQSAALPFPRFATITKS